MEVTKISFNRTMLNVRDRHRRTHTDFIYAKFEKNNNNKGLTDKYLCSKIIK